MERVINNKQKELLQKSEISIWLDTYDDIFSVFDSRPYSERALSVDFLDEIKRASRDKPSGETSLNMLIPVKQGNQIHELLIKKRLKEHFKKHYDMLRKEIKSIRKQGSSFVIFGILTMFVATLILLYAPKNNLLYSFLVILFEPGGWFLFWEGLNLIVFEPNEKKPEAEFYEKMSKVDIVFHTYK